MNNFKFIIDIERNRYNGFQPPLNCVLGGLWGYEY